MDAEERRTSPPPRQGLKSSSGGSSSGSCRGRPEATRTHARMDDPATRPKGRQPRLGDGSCVSRPGPAGNHTDAWRGGGLTLRPREHGLRSRDHGHAVRPADAAAGLQRVRWRRRNSGCGGCDPGEIPGGCASSPDGAAVAGGGRLGATATTACLL